MFHLKLHRVKRTPMSGAPESFDFGKVADSYDSWYCDAVGRAYDALQKRAVERILPTPRQGERLLEVGCGTGHWSQFFAERGFRVTGTDISPEMIRVASRKTIADIHFQVSDAERLPFRDGEFDVAAAITVLEFAAHPRGVLQEMARCLRPGGRMIVGALNKYSVLGIWRRLRRSRTFASARFFSLPELRYLLSEFDPAAVQAVAFLIPWRRLLWMAPALDAIGRTCRLPWGDFLVGKGTR